MPPAGQNSTVPLQEVVDYARTFGELTPVLKTGGWADQPARSIADRVMETLLGGGYVAGRRVGPFPWKWNRTIPPAFLTNSWQQDYASVVAQAAGGTYNTLKWLADAILLDINNTALPKPMYGLEVKRDLPLTSAQWGRPGQVCWLRNVDLQYGRWGGAASTIVGPPNPAAGSVYTNPIGAASSPANPVTQIVDANGNLLVLVTYGVEGTTAPVAGAAAAPGTLATPGSGATTAWMVADPYGQGFRISPRPPQTGVTYQVQLLGQMPPARFTRLGQLIDPVPDDFQTFFKEGFVTFCYQNSPEMKTQAKFEMRFKLWMDQLMEALGTGDKEQDQGGFYPDRGVMDQYPIGPIGPAWPYGGRWGA